MIYLILLYFLGFQITLVKVILDFAEEPPRQHHTRGTVYNLAITAVMVSILWPIAIWVI